MPHPRTHSLRSAKKRLNLPICGLVNRFGYPWSCTGTQFEVYADRVMFRPRNFVTGRRFVNSEYSFDLV